MYSINSKKTRLLSSNYYSTSWPWTDRFLLVCFHLLVTAQYRNKVRKKGKIIEYKYSEFTVSSAHEALGFWGYWDTKHAQRSLNWGVGKHKPGSWAAIIDSLALLETVKAKISDTRLEGNSENGLTVVQQVQHIAHEVLGGRGERRGERRGGRTTFKWAGRGGPKPKHLFEVPLIESKVSHSHTEVQQAGHFYWWR